MSNVSLERYYIVLYDGALTLKMKQKWRLTRFAIKLFICTPKLFVLIYVKGTHFNTCRS